MINITYVYAGNRKVKFENKNFDSRDFFYGLTFFDNKNFNLNIIEPIENNSMAGKALSFIDMFFKKVLNLPVYTREFLNINNIKTLLKSDKIILVNETTFCSLAPLLLFLKLFKNIEVYVFVMGLYSKKLRFPYLEKLHFLIIKIFILTSTNILFLGKGEFDKANLTHKSISSKFILFPFYIDFRFWNSKYNIDIKERNKILFVGNDGNRDYKLFLEIVKILKNYQFVAITNNPLILNNKLPNLELPNKNKTYLSDKELKNYYLNCKFVILPLKNSFQPSGQSVSLQTMASKRAVLLSYTDGFWDQTNFINNEDIKFIFKNNVSSWVSTIKEVYNDQNFLTGLEKKGYENVKYNLNMDIFRKKLFELLNINNFTDTW